MGSVSRYNPWLVGIHWFMAFMLVTVLLVGFLVLGETPNTDPKKIQLLLFHMSGGIFLATLMILRLVVRLRSKRPETASVGNPLADKLAPVTHYGFYLVVLLLAATGLATALLAGLNKSVFQANGDPLPSTFDVFPTFEVHETLAILLAVLVGLHVLAALYHQFVRKDGLFRRMWFGSRLLQTGPDGTAAE